LRGKKNVIIAFFKTAASSISAESSLISAESEASSLISAESEASSSVVKKRP